jgi:predicted amidohydrolase
MMDKYTVTVGQLVLTDPGQVYDQINKIMVDHPETDLFVFPEFATQSNINLNRVSYLQENRAARQTALKWLSLVPDYAKVKARAGELGKAVIIGSISQQEDRLFSRAVFYDPQRQQYECYDKSHVHWTEDFLRPGETIAPFNTRFGAIGLLICYDMAFVEPTRVLGIQGTQILFALSAIPEHFHWKYPHRRMIGAAIFNQYYVIASNLGHAPQAPMGGYSGIYSPEGDLVAQIEGRDFSAISASIDLDEVKRWREKEMIDPYREPHLYQVITAPVEKV